MKPTTFSIITIVYNNLAYIKKTMDSVINQTYKEIEYILIDGGSVDGTKEAIFEYIASYATITQETIKQDSFYLEATAKLFPTFTFKFLSEKDKGIYDAMNKGIALATKEWINFMNCEDCFYHLDILEKVAMQNLQNYSVIYGDTEMIDKTHSYIQHPSTHFKSRIPFCHQSSFTRTSVHSLFDTSYKICADYAFFINLYKSGHKFKKLHFPIASYSLNGISASPSWQMFYEQCRITYTFNKLFPLYLALKWILWTLPKSKVKGLIKR
ncbi:glycosyltransferase family 2 protein [Helicobacter cholecystus]|uniref:glycosyltransferase family 2 protein n=1 Tax=Helicobacter cholecystus TaxID=45498 RepID=UPI000F70F58E|nr:glycosyltransferase family 2 protein [Helicobacter cholecystus]VEJ24446.1 glycosyltransferase family protein [Helicobacter cholecystus]